jgi:peptidoglycan/LPS O-acetylase OafA/YrhL
VDLLLAGATAAGLLGAVLLARGRADRRTLAGLAVVAAAGLVVVAVRISHPPDPTLEAGPGASLALAALALMLAVSLLAALRPARRAAPP